MNTLDEDQIIRALRISRPNPLDDSAYRTWLLVVHNFYASLYTYRFPDDGSPSGDEFRAMCGEPVFDKAA
jgi:hypothetical protein